MKVIVNGQSSEVHEINSGVLQGSLLNPTLFLLYINTLRLLVNMYADNITVYRCTSKYFGNECLAADLCSDLTLTAQCGK